MIIFDPVLLLAKISQTANVGRALSAPSELLSCSYGWGCFGLRSELSRVKWGEKDPHRTFQKTGPSFNSLFLGIRELRILRPTVPRSATGLM